MDILTRIRTVLTAAVFWLGIAGSVVAVVLQTLGEGVENDVTSAIVGVLAPAATVIATLSLIIRRVTPVIKADRTLLPIDYPRLMQPVEREHQSLRDAGLSLIETIVLMVLVAFAIYGAVVLFS